MHLPAFALIYLLVACSSLAAPIPERQLIARGPGDKATAAAPSRNPNAPTNGLPSHGPAPSAEPKHVSDSSGDRSPVADAKSTSHKDSFLHNLRKGEGRSGSQQEKDTSKMNELEIQQETLSETRKANKGESGGALGRRTY